MKYTIDGMRNMWLDFWKSKNHAIIKSASTLPENDPTTLFTVAGMHPLVPYLMGEKHPAGTRLANSQKCIRTNDIDEVGDATHLTFFEMLGNWSLGDYFKQEQIEWSYEFLIDVLKLPKEKLAVSVFVGDEDAPKDEEAAQKWIECGMPKNRIAYLGKEDNWWAKGATGPCGPDTEMFYWTGEEPAPESYQDTYEDERWVEIWNDVFMAYDRQEDGSLVPFKNPNIDTGMGLERAVFVLNGLKSVYQTDAFEDGLTSIAELANKKELLEDLLGETPNHYSLRIIADHIRSAVILVSDGVVPSNTDQGYVLRRILRRAIMHGRKLGIEGNFGAAVAQTFIDKLGTHYTNVAEKSAVILEEIEREEIQFAKTLVSGQREFEKLIGKVEGVIPGEKAFFLYETYGFPLEMTIELAGENGLTVEAEGFEKALEAHQAKSRAGAENKFSGGLADESEETVKLHTATHLLHAALRKVLGDHVRQRGSNITPERLRFDFDHDEKMTPEQKQEVEDFVNEAIAAEVNITMGEMSVDEAKTEGALGFFEDKYGDVVKVYDMRPFSLEICGGPHVENTKTLGRFKIKKEQSASRGVRRIKAVLISE